MQSVEKTWFERSEQEQSAPADDLALAKHRLKQVKE